MVAEELLLLIRLMKLKLKNLQGPGCDGKGGVDALKAQSGTF